MDLLSVAYLLIAIGVVFLMAELFIPMGGVCFLIAAVLLILGVTLTFLYGDQETGLITLGAVFVIFPIVLWGVFYFWPPGLYGKRLIPTEEDNVTVASIPANAQLEQLRGRIGKTVSPLRPAGIVEFDGRRIDCVSEGMMIDINQWVRCIEVQAHKVVVRRIEKANLEDFENTTFG